MAWGLVAVVLVSTSAEILPFHFLLPWQWLKTLTLILAVYGLLWIVGYAASMSRFPHHVSERALSGRFGALDDAIIPWKVISSVEVHRKKFAAGAPSKPVTIPAKLPSLPTVKRSSESSSCHR